MDIGSLWAAIGPFVHQAVTVIGFMGALFGLGALGNKYVSTEKKIGLEKLKHDNEDFSDHVEEFARKAQATIWTRVEYAILQAALNTELHSLRAEFNEAASTIYSQYSFLNYFVDKMKSDGYTKRSLRELVKSGVGIRLSVPDHRGGRLRGAIQRGVRRVIPSASMNESQLRVVGKSINEFVVDCRELESLFNSTLSAMGSKDRVDIVDALETGKLFDPVRVMAGILDHYPESLDMVIRDRGLQSEYAVAQLISRSDLPSTASSEEHILRGYERSGHSMDEIIGLHTGGSSRKAHPEVNNEQAKALERHDGKPGYEYAQLERQQDRGVYGADSLPADPIHAIAILAERDESKRKQVFPSSSRMGSAMHEIVGVEVVHSPNTKKAEKSARSARIRSRNRTTPTTGRGH